MAPLAEALELEELPLDSPELDCASFLQAGFWGHHKAKFGWQPRAFRAAGVPLLCLVRRAGPLPGLAYLPHWPNELALSRLRSAFGGQDGSVVADGEILACVAKALAAALDLQLFLVRFDPELEVEEADVSGLAPLEKGRADIQPSSTVLLDLPSAAEGAADPGTRANTILEAMKSKHRYNIRLAAKKGVEVARLTADDPNFDAELAAWYRAYQETAQRDGISIHSADYYRALFEQFPEDKGAGAARGLFLYQARHEGDYLAGIVVVHWNCRATYLYGASTNTKRNLMPAYALQWSAIEDAVSAGLDSYDLFGIPPASDPDHPMFGLFQFKTGFGGRIVRYPGTWDFKLSKFWDFLFSARERLVDLKKRLSKRK